MKPTAEFVSAFTEFNEWLREETTPYYENMAKNKPLPRIKVGFNDHLFSRSEVAQALKEQAKKQYCTDNKLITKWKM